MNIILDRFHPSHIDYFINYFENNGYYTKLASLTSSPNHQISNKIEWHIDSNLMKADFKEKLAFSLDADLLKKLSTYEGIFVLTLSRFSIFPGFWSAREMSEHYYLIANFWYSKIKSYEIQGAISFTAPHDPASFSLYIMCKILRIPYVFIDPVRLANNIKTISCSYSQRNLLLRKGSNFSPAWAEEIVSRYINNISSDFDSGQHESLYKSSHQNNSLPISSLFAKLKPKIRKVLASKNPLGFVFKRLFPHTPSFFKVSRASFTGSHFSTQSRFRWSFIRFIVIIRIFLFKKSYLQRVKTDKEFFMSKKKYIYFPLPLEPEGSNLPGALENRSIRNALHRILDVIPSDCFLVIKANPLQFKISGPIFSTYPAWHSLDYYSTISVDKRVIFASQYQNSGELIDNSIGVVCINGTAAIEAPCRGKHSIIFSPMWFDSTPGVHLCRTKADIQEAIRLMQLYDVPTISARDFFMNERVIFDRGVFKADDLDPAVLEDAALCILNALEDFNELDDSKWDL